MTLTNVHMTTIDAVIRPQHHMNSWRRCEDPSLALVQLKQHESDWMDHEVVAALLVIMMMDFTAPPSPLPIRGL